MGGWGSTIASPRLASSLPGTGSRWLGPGRFNNPSDGLVGLVCFHLCSRASAGLGFLLFPVVVSIPSHTSLMLFSRSCFASLVRGLTAVPEALHCFHFCCFHVVGLQLGLEPVSQAATVPHNDRRAVRVANRRLCVSAPSAAVKHYPCCLQSGKSSRSLEQSLRQSWWLRVLPSLRCEQEL